MIFLSTESYNVQNEIWTDGYFSVTKITTFSFYQLVLIFHILDIS